MTCVLFKYLAILLSSWLLWLPITFWFGRCFCRRLCPLGLSQSLVALVVYRKRSVRRVCANLPRSRVQRAVNWALVLVYFLSPLGYLLHPWGIFGRAVFACFLPGLVFFGAVVISAAFGQGRLWCNWVCPLGTIFDLVASLGWRRERIGRGCGNCRRCFK